eukprot:1810139-Rhodomonas_salina.1
MKTCDSLLANSRRARPIDAQSPFESLYAQSPFDCESESAHTSFRAASVCPTDRVWLSALTRKNSGGAAARAMKATIRESVRESGDARRSVRAGDARMEGLRLGNGDCSTRSEGKTSSSLMIIASLGSQEGSPLTMTDWRINDDAE